MSGLIYLQRMPLLIIKSINASFNDAIKNELFNDNFHSVSDITYIKSLSEVQDLRSFYSEIIINLKRNGKSKIPSIPKTNLTRLSVDISDY